MAPARAIQCATTLVAVVRTLGLEIRVGIHTGECGGFWKPVGLLSAIAALGNRPMAAAAAVALVDEVDCGSYLTRNALGRHKTAVNVVAERGDPSAERTLSSWPTTTRPSPA